MPLQDRLSHAALVAKWKVDQQSRLMRIQGEMRDMENQIRSQKAVLADTAIMLFNQTQLQEPELLKICTAIASLRDNIQAKQREHEAVRQEQPPDQAYNASLPASGLVCPKCGRLLVGRFCPEHGVEGVPVSPPVATEMVNQSGAAPTEGPAGQLVCPTCGRVLKGKFCPEHGIEGIPA